MNALAPATRMLRPRRVTRFVDRPIETQRLVLEQILKRAELTTYGRDNGFASIRNTSDVAKAFRERVPLQSYEDLRPYVELTRAGEKDVLWPGLVSRFAVSSGTASSGKHIPASTEMLQTIRRCGLEVLQSYIAASGHYDIMLGRLLAVSGRTDPDAENGNAIIGEMSGLVRTAAPLWLTRFWQAVPDSIAEIRNWDTKLASIAAATASEDVRAIAMVPSWAVSLFDKLLRTGGLEGPDSIGELWPNLRVFFSSGVPLSSYRNLLDRYLDKSGVHYLELYTASEGFFAFQDRLGADDMLLHLDSGVYYEFVPCEDLGVPSPTRLALADVECGRRYALYVTTCAGLFAYAMRDLVEFTSTSPHRIRVVGRTTEMLDNYGEALFADEAREALGIASSLHGANVAHCHVSAVEPDDSDKLPRHEWLIEFVNEPDDCEAFRNTLDALICTANRHYEIRRQARSLHQLRMVALPRGTFDRWLRRARKSVGAQTKVPFMSPNRTIASEILASCA